MINNNTPCKRVRRRSKWKYSRRRDLILLPKLLRLALQKVILLHHYNSFIILLIRIQVWFNRTEFAPILAPKILSHDKSYLIVVLVVYRHFFYRTHWLTNNMDYISSFRVQNLNNYFPLFFFIVIQKSVFILYTIPITFHYFELVSY